MKINFAWQGNKAYHMLMMFILGMLAAKEVPEDLLCYLLPGIAFIFGWCRDTEASDIYWFKGNPRE